MKPVTVTQFICAVCIVAKENPRPVLAVDFEPSSDGIRLTFRYRSDR